MNVTPVLNVVSLQHMNTKGEAHPVSHTFIELLNNWIEQGPYFLRIAECWKP